MSQHFLVKAMFLVIVGRLIPHRVFDYKVMLECVSKEVVGNKLKPQQNLSNDVLINSTIKIGE